MVVAPPYVTYSSYTEATLPVEDWNLVYPSLQAFKGHVQEYPGCQSFDVFVRAQADRMLLHCYTTWDTAEQLEAYLQRGYTVDRMLDDVAGLEPDHELVMEKVF